MRENGKPKYESAAQKGGNPYRKEDVEAAIRILNSGECGLFIKDIVSRCKKN